METIINSNVEKVVLLFDGDDPGRNAITKAGRAFLEAGVPAIAPLVQEDFKPHRSSIQELQRLLDGWI